MSVHPSKDITGTEGEELRGKHIILCVTGSVAAVRSPEIARCLMRRGADVSAVMTEMAQFIIHPFVMEWATGNPVVLGLTGKIEHVALAGERAEKADLLLVAPATANTISKVACGIDDTPVTSTISTAFGSRLPIIVVPAMHESMYNHPIVMENIRKLKSLGIEFIDPQIEEGKAKIANTAEIVEAVVNRLTIKRNLSGKKVLVTAGPTVEHIDPIRVITNTSSGKMGMAIVEEALRRGAETTLIYGPAMTPAPAGVRVISVETTDQMHKAVVKELKSETYDLMIAVAATGDWTVEKPFQHKVSTRHKASLELKLVPTKKIINQVKVISPKTRLVAFRAEYSVSEEELVDSAYEELKRANADLVVANDVAKSGVGFGTDTNEVLIVDGKKRVIRVAMSPKRDVARRIFEAINEKN